jgi:integrase
VPSASGSCPLRAPLGFAPSSPGSQVGVGIVGGDPAEERTELDLVHHQPRRRLLPALRALAYGTFDRQLETPLQPEPVELLASALFPGFVGANLRTSITRACKATGTPHFYPHGLRKRRGSLLSKQGYSLAEISERLGDTKVVTAEHYLYALGDYTEVDYAVTLGR